MTPARLPVATRFARTALAALALAAGTAAAATAPRPFTATYQVQQDGQTIGKATVTLTAVGKDEYTYRNRSRGTGGLAALIGANTDETTRFRWHDDAPETMTYDYAMDSSFKRKHRHLQVDRASNQVTVDEGKGPIHYAGTAGMVDRNTLPLALGLALRDGDKQVVLPVGVKQRVEKQQYAVQATERLAVPAGEFSAERVTRTDTDKPFDAWYVPAKFPVPVKLAQADGGNLTLLLESFHSP
ncbi:DUF3108 domain-containing protein [Dyella lutea]|uniref:DUF3108 domain-containing protein n=1 Tax=Dyella lutea TaxID=2950441 RepID=A0ABT1F8F9_9GAMM|nr:DUF3108 domain-containing protein [Dyella lutea]MCP1373654.1 DUF3108 domain-containing protein [Dyella lutea]